MAAIISQTLMTRLHAFIWKTFFFRIFQIKTWRQIVLWRHAIDDLFGSFLSEGLQKKGLLV